MGIYPVTSLFLTVLSEMFHLVGVISSKWPCHCWLVEETNPHGHTRAGAQIRPRVLDLFQFFCLFSYFLGSKTNHFRLVVGTWILWLSIQLGIIIIPSDEVIFFRGVGLNHGIPPTRFTIDWISSYSPVCSFFSATNQILRCGPPSDVSWFRFAPVTCSWFAYHKP